MGNSVLGLAMYASYFVLFLKLFVDNYYLKPRTQRLRSVREVVRSMSRKITQNVEAEVNVDDEGTLSEPTSRQWSSCELVRTKSSRRTNTTEPEVGDGDEEKPTSRQWSSRELVCTKSCRKTQAMETLVDNGNKDKFSEPMTSDWANKKIN